MAKKGEKSCLLIKKMKGDPHKLLTTILIGNNLVNVAAAAYATAVTIGVFPNYAVGISTGAMTLLILVFGEVFPKSIATRNNILIARLTIFPIFWLSVVFFPVIKFLNFIPWLTGRIKKPQTLSEEELITFVEVVEEEGKIKGIQFFFGSTNSVGKTGLQELLKGNALEKVTQEMQLVKETRLVESFLAELGKGTGLAEYGPKEVKEAVEMGSVKKLIVADSFLLEKRDEAEMLMKNAESSGAEVHLVNAEHEAGKQLVNLGGVAAILRYKIK